MSTPKKRTTKSKSEVKDEFDAVVDKYSDKEAISTKESDAIRRHQESVLAKIKSLTPESVTQAITAAQFEMQRTLGDISQLVIEKTNELHTVTEGVDLQKAELERLHGVDVVASAIDVLIEDHNERKQQLENDIRTTRELWAKEQEQHDNEVQARDEQLALERAREQDDFAYRTAQLRRGEEDQWREHMRQVQAQERDRREQQEKNWREREAALKAQEQDIINLRAEVASFPDKLKKEVDKQLAITTNSMSRDHKHQIEMLTAHANSTQTLLQSELTQERKVSAALEAQVKELTAKLAEANTKVTEVATEALKSASGQSALAAVQKFASESGSNGPSKRS